MIPVFQRNGYFANPESNLHSMCLDDSPIIRKTAITLIQEARAINMENSNRTIREFQIPIIKLDASHYSGLIDELILTESPMFEELSNVEIEQIEFETMKRPEYPCHTQCVERYEN